MALRLSSAEIAAVERANSVLLSPFCYENGESWRRAAARAVEVCLGADASSFNLLIADEPLFGATQEVVEILKAVDPPPDWVVQALLAFSRQNNLGVVDWEELFDAKEIRHGHFYNEVVRPQRLLAPLTMLVETGAAPIPATLSVYSTDEKRASRHLPRRRELMRLLLPAFSAGIMTYLTYRQNKAVLAALAEDAALGVCLFDAAGNLTSENAFFQELMRGESDRQRVRVQVAHAVHDVLAVAQVRSSQVRRVQAQLQTACARYRIAACCMHSMSTDRRSAIALVDRVDGRKNTIEALAERFALTTREVEVATLLRGGRSSGEIADTLGISVNTARRHTESILLKLGVHTRAAAAAKLSGSYTDGDAMNPEYTKY